MDSLRHIPDILTQYQSYPKRDRAFGYWREGQWSFLSSDQFVDYVQSVALGLRSMGLKKGDRVGILAKSSPFWTVADLAITIAGGIVVPFFTNLSEEHFLFEVGDANPRFLFVGDEKDWDFVCRHAHRFEATIGLEESSQEKTTFDLYDLIRKGSVMKGEAPALLNEIAQGIHSNDLATIIYTSGSTGLPKGVELTHRNLVAVIDGDDFDLTPDDLYLSVLPLAHIFAKQINYIMIAWGVQMYHLNDLTKVGDICREIHPTCMIAVPRLLEKVYGKMVQKVNDAGFLKKAFGRWAFDLVTCEGGLYKTLMHPLADKLVYGKLRDALGGRMRLLVSGGATLSPAIQKFFLEIGVPVVQGWGMTEVTCIAINRLEGNKIGTVGRPLGNAEFKVSREGELLVRGPTVMRGYHNQQELTNSVIDQEGWFHTGDRAHFDEDGHIVIDGRMNESFKTAQGEWIIPVPIEQKINEAPLIDVSIVLGDGQPYATALLFPDREVLQKLKKEHQAEDVSDEQFLQSPFIVQEMSVLLSKINGDLDEWSQVHGWRFILTPPSIENGQLTPTMKLRRKEIEKTYKTLIQQIYAQEAA